MIIKAPKNKFEIHHHPHIKHPFFLVLKEIKFKFKIKS
jgi:hypothetical protein